MKLTQIRVAWFLLIVIAIAMMLIPVFFPVKAHADTIRYPTNCYAGVQSIAANSNNLFYTCKDAGDHSIYHIQLY